MNKPESLELCERLERCAEWLSTGNIGPMKESEFNQWAADIRSIIIPAPGEKDEKNN